MNFPKSQEFTQLFGLNGMRRRRHVHQSLLEHQELRFFSKAGIQHWVSTRAPQQVSKNI